jgi:hypothetical protein
MSKFAPSASRAVLPAVTVHADYTVPVLRSGPRVGSPGGRGAVHFEHRGRPAHRVNATSSFRRHAPQRSVNIVRRRRQARLRWRTEAWLRGIGQASRQL